MAAEKGRVEIGKKTYEVNVRHTGRQDEKKDAQLHNLAKRFRGEFNGSGYFFGDGGEQDMQFGFKDRLGAKGFESAVRDLGFQVLMAAKR